MKIGKQNKNSRDQRRERKAGFCRHFPLMSFCSPCFGLLHLLFVTDYLAKKPEGLGRPDPLDIDVDVSTVYDSQVLWVPQVPWKTKMRQNQPVSICYFLIFLR